MVVSPMRQCCLPFPQVLPLLQQLLPNFANDLVLFNTGCAAGAAGLCRALAVHPRWQAVLHWAAVFRASPGCPELLDL